MKIFVSPLKLCAQGRKKSAQRVIPFGEEINRWRWGRELRNEMMTIHEGIGGKRNEQV
jgi:hypothetical protein